MADVLGEILAGHGRQVAGHRHRLFQRAGVHPAARGPAGAGELPPAAGGRAAGRRVHRAAASGRLAPGPGAERRSLRRGDPPAVEDLIAFLRRDMVGVRAYQQGFLHAKSYIFYGDLPVGGADRFQPIAAIVGSSNFTGAGLTTNRELEPLPQDCPHRRGDVPNRPAPCRWTRGDGASP